MYMTNIYKNYIEIQESKLKGTGMNNISRQMFNQFKKINNVTQDRSRGSNSIQSVNIDGNVFGFTVIDDIIEHIKSGRDIDIRQNYGFDGMLVGELKTGFVYSIQKSNFMVGSISRKTAKKGIPAYNTKINIINSIKSKEPMKKTEYKIYN